MSYAHPSAQHAALHHPPTLLRRAIAASAPGNATEWFDYGIYAYGLTYISAALFPALFPAMFPTDVRYAGMAIAYIVSTSLFRETALRVNQWLAGQTGNHLVPAYYTMAACVIGALALIFVTETSGCSLRGRGIRGKTQKYLA
jgi:hypothetical protein